MVSQSAMGVDGQVKLCPYCQALGRTGALVLRQINIDEAIYVCSDNQCFYPVAVASIENELVKRHIMEWDDKETIEKQLENSSNLCSGTNLSSHIGSKQPATAPHTPSLQPGSSPHSLGHQEYALDGSYQAFSSFGAISHQPSGQFYPSYGQQSIDSDYQQLFGTFSFGGHTAAHQYGWPGHNFGGHDSHLGYLGKQADGAQHVDDMDSFIDSLFQS